MRVGYMRVSTDGERQVLDLQRDALLQAGVDERHLFEDHASGSRDDRAGLTKALAFVRPGDCLVVWKLDRLGRSMPHLIATVNGLKDRNVAFRSLTEQMDTTTPQGELLFHVFGALAQLGSPQGLCAKPRKPAQTKNMGPAATRAGDARVLSWSRVAKQIRLLPSL